MAAAIAVVMAMAAQGHAAHDQAIWETIGSKRIMFYE
jgi:hypothetical protein